jgi:hypothetical protein
VIVNIADVVALRRAWIVGRGNALLFDAAVSVLDAATCRADVRFGLANPPYQIKATVNGSEWHVGVNGSTMLRFKLTEDARGHADVEILP